MKRVTMAAIMIFAILSSGCICCPMSYKNVVREYNHSAASNVTINVYSDNRPLILKTDDSEIRVIEYFEIDDAPISGEVNHVSYLSDYVNFYGDKRNLNVSIMMVNLVGECRARNVNLTIYLPEYANYTINITGSGTSLYNQEKAPYKLKIE